MTALLAALQILGLEADVALDGRWVAILVGQVTVYVIEAKWGESFYVWCDSAEGRAVERYSTAIEAIQSGLRRSRSGPG